MKQLADDLLKPGTWADRLRMLEAAQRQSGIAKSFIAQSMPASY